VLEIRALAEQPSEDDRNVARSLLVDRSAEDLVAALVHLRRQARPVPEELTPPASMRPRRSPPKPSHTDRDDATWFTINVGRSKNADPKWLIPLLCRRGNITKRSIGKIQILARETHVRIANDVADAFAVAIRQPDDKDPNIHIEKLDRPR
jgi:ATP-dependent RNA helicase DeaD